ncbi:hypothetical protein [Streptomyces inhibens]|uniref:hypothetical protein n=1 Tax=Streptomyces inhibens TaxID=2293571 RepID=UPI001EE752D6|nr:hypothetical protein [Streptomyces inhibens]UKY55585.1 hypothetical protein KI385_02410 [Streptomyces inhibens]
MRPRQSWVRPGGPGTPVRRLVVLLLIPPSALTLLVAGALAPFGRMMMLTIVLTAVAVTGLAAAVFWAFPSTVPDPPGVLLWPAFGLVLAPVVLAALATHAYVLEVRGVTRPAVVARVVEHHGKSTSYECIMRYGGGAQGPVSISCENNDRAGDEVRVVWDPEGAVKPEFERDVGDASCYADFAMAADVLVMCLADGVAAVGFVRRHTEARRRAVATPGGIGAVARTPQLAPDGSADDPDRSVRCGCVP